jgi:chemotaxis protein MotB
MSRKKKQDAGPGGVPEWMATYGDLVTLLMCFFVLLFAFSSIDAQKFEAVMKSFQGSAGILSGGTSLTPADMVFDGMPEVEVSKPVTNKEDLEVLKKAVEKFIAENQLESKVTVELEDRGLLLRFEDNALFDSGKADLKEGSLNTLKFLAEILNTEEFNTKNVRVEGHTDNRPINTAKFPSNWELSTTRASNVVRFFIERGNMIPSRFSASGYSEYYPIASNDLAEGRAMNRRVDIVVLRDVDDVDLNTQGGDN